MTTLTVAIIGLCIVLLFRNVNITITHKHITECPQVEASTTETPEQDLTPPFNADDIVRSINQSLGVMVNEED